LKSEGSKKVRKIERKTLREVTVKIGLERIDMQEGVIVEALLDSGATGLVVKITRSGLHLFYFSLDLLFIFLFLEQLGLGSEVICHTVTSVTI